jgi:hypothetical protein
MKKVDPPVLTDPRVRDDYDTTWALYPWEHPAGYWLRASDSQAICTRCGARMWDGTPPTDFDQIALDLETFVDTHLRCPLGYGLGEGAVAPFDPLFEGGPDEPNDPGGPGPGPGRM